MSLSFFRDVISHGTTDYRGCNNRKMVADIRLKERWGGLRRADWGRDNGSDPSDSALVPGSITVGPESPQELGPNFLHAQRPHPVRLAGRRSEKYSTKFSGRNSLFVLICNLNRFTNKLWSTHTVARILYPKALKLLTMLAFKFTIFAADPDVLKSRSADMTICRTRGIPISVVIIYALSYSYRLPRNSGFVVLITDRVEDIKPPRQLQRSVTNTQTTSLQRKRLE
ncbi:uncharacterized protein BT62DRAFT_1000298 [Guyanagaster necrorhizus]|uniref:Uncharacterized protein n=1 Tax=Guyanagaster necrorhizus TaxID=856835 RepID=A0A9P7W1T4_9AGAR|nr:uncharacterized protein BT62DRAFT_1000298 [Guyanagaster necrorhizus MCA 3950]KAG7451067.1 hypothetical protein BT62DRAFT_1000298 [Guyanagaster necrorhizus MCA 3950]